MYRNEHLDAFMARSAGEGLTYDDVTLVTRYADFLPDEAVIETRLTSRITANMPFVSAAMDTVTESRMAIGMALLGGIGVIHKNLTPAEQASRVAAVKRHLHGLIIDPVVFHPAQTLAEVRAAREAKGYGFSGFPIVEDDGRLVGILTSKDTKFTADPNALVSDVMSAEVITAAPATSLQEAYRLMMRHKIGKLPLVERGRLVGLYAFSDVKMLVENVKPLYNRDAKYRLRVAAAVSGGDHERAERLADAETDVIVVDSAHGHTRGIVEMVRWLAAHYPDIDIVAGNVGAAEGAVALRDAGAHAVKVGIGPGSICTTRVVCGVGVPQVTAVYECARALDGSVPIVADGGVRHSGDVPKAIAAGADTVMMGSIMAGTDESPGEKMIHQGRQYVVYRGMGSLAAMREGMGSRERYAQHHAAEEELVPQGIEGIVPYAGTVAHVMNQFCGGLRAAMGYCGCRTFAELQTSARFMRVTFAGMQEAHPHDIKIIKEAPNYRS